MLRDWELQFIGCRHQALGFTYAQKGGEIVALLAFFLVYGAWTIILPTFGVRVRLGSIRFRWHRA